MIDGGCCSSTTIPHVGMRLGSSIPAFLMATKKKGTHELLPYLIMFIDSSKLFHIVTIDNGSYWDLQNLILWAPAVAIHSLEQGSWLGRELYSESKDTARNCNLLKMIQLPNTDNSTSKESLSLRSFSDDLTILTIVAIGG
eukprot:scaffold14332_cov57-Attheya_sp.AAC.3